MADGPLRLALREFTSMPLLLCFKTQCFACNHWQLFKSKEPL